MEKVKKPTVLVTFDSMRHPNTGFFFYGRSLSHALLDQNNNRFDFSFYSHKSVPAGALPSGVRKINKSLLHKIIFPYKFDLVHFSNQYCKPHPALVKGKKILTIHDINPYYERKDNPKKLNRYVKRIRSFINNCDRIVAISNFVASEVEKYFPEAKGKLSVIHNGADALSVPSNFTPRLQPKKPFLFTIGMVCEKKNFHVLPCLLENNDLELIIAGIIKGDYKDRILEEAKKYRCEDRVKIIGTVSDDEKAWYYQNCNAFMFPSLAEGFGLPVIEAMHFGKPVFLSRLTSLPEIGGEEAFYFDSFEEGEMRRVFKEGMEHYQTFYGKKTALINRAKNFNWNFTALKYLEIYESLIKK